MRMVLIKNSGTYRLMMVVVFLLQLGKRFAADGFFCWFHLGFCPGKQFVSLYTVITVFHKLPVLHHFFYIIMSGRPYS